MRLLITSFGTGLERGPEIDQTALFHRMPPVPASLNHGLFQPDYSLLLLASSLIMDELSFERLVLRPPEPYRQVAETFHALRGEGLIQLVDFQSILSAYEPSLYEMLSLDLAHVDEWQNCVLESIDAWTHFRAVTRDAIPPRFESPDYYQRYNSRAMMMSLSHFVHEYAYQRSDAQSMHVVASILASMNAEERKAHLHALLRRYLPYVNANLVLAAHFDAGFHDWNDFLPFYRRKFQTVALSPTPVEKKRIEAEKLFAISFPEFRIDDYKTFMRAVQDPRIGDLRSMIDRAARGEVAFDHRFAAETYRAVWGTEVRISRWRNIVGYLTLPFGFLPIVGAPVQEAVKEMAMYPVEQHLKAGYRWFYLLSDVRQQRRFGRRLWSGVSAR